MKTYIKENNKSKCSTIELNGKLVMNPTEEEILSAGWVEYVPEATSLTIEEVRNKKLDELAEYDSSSSVNSFSFMGAEMWFNKNDRNSLSYLADCHIAKGNKFMPLHHEGVKFDLPPEQVKMLLIEIEIYAGDCYNTTEQHKANIKDLKTIEEIESYDFTTNYPNKIEV